MFAARLSGSGSGLTPFPMTDRICSYHYEDDPSRVCQSAPLKPETCQDLGLDPDRPLCSAHAGLSSQNLLDPAEAGRRSGESRARSAAERGRRIIDRLAEVFDEEAEEVVRAQLDRAKGTQAVRYMKDGEEVVYDVLPDVRAFAHVLDRLVGKPVTQVADVTEEHRDASQLTLAEIQDRRRALLAAHPDLLDRLPAPVRAGQPALPPAEVEVIEEGDFTIPPQSSSQPEPVPAGPVPAAPGPEPDQASPAS